MKRPQRARRNAQPRSKRVAATLLPLDSFQPAFGRAALAGAVVGGAMAIGPLAQAQSTQAPPAAQEGVTTLAPIDVTGQAPYQVNQASSPKFTAPLRDTPKTVTVIPEQLIRDRGVSSLDDVLRTTPGITLGSGEGGTPTGDRPFVRGYEASTDIFIDGVRDYARGYHETFNLEQIEIVKGPSSAYTGRGGTGGSINLATKRPRDYNFAEVTAGFGSDDQWRSTVDGNVVIGNRIGLRINAMKRGGEMPGRDGVKVDRLGFAPSITFGLDLPTRATLSYSLVRNRDTPDQGFPFVNNAHPERNTPPKAKRENFYGRRGVDFRDAYAKETTLLLEHDFASGTRVRNLTRHSDTLNHYLFTRPSFDGCAAGNTTAACDPGHQDAQFRRANRARWRSSKSLVNQTDLSGAFHTGAFQHTFATGIEFGKERIWSKAMGNLPALPNNSTSNDSFHHPNTHGFSSTDITYGPKLKAGELETTAFYLFDTMQINEQFSLNAGLRYDIYQVTSYNAAGKRNAQRDDGLFNYQLGLVYKPLPYGSIYLSYATSSNPSGENLGQAGGADGAAGAGSISNQGREGLAPEKSRSIELGTKWDLFNEQLSLTAALFETKKTDARSQDPVSGNVELQGENRVRGVELGVAGAITPAWDIWAGYTYMNPKVLKYRSGGTDYDGTRMKFIPKYSASLWTTYKVLPEITVGGGATYMGMRYANDNNSLKLPSYTRYDAMARYDINKAFSLQLNANNLTNTRLYDSSHVGIFYHVGPGRSYMMTASYRYN